MHIWFPWISWTRSIQWARHFRIILIITILNSFMTMTWWSKCFWIYIIFFSSFCSNKFDWCFNKFTMEKYALRLILEPNLLPIISSFKVHLGDYIGNRSKSLFFSLEREHNLPTIRLINRNLSSKVWPFKDKHDIVTPLHSFFLIGLSLDSLAEPDYIICIKGCFDEGVGCFLKESEKSVAKNVIQPYLFQFLLVS